MKFLKPNRFYNSCCMYISPLYESSLNPKLMVHPDGMCTISVDPTNCFQNAIGVFNSEFDTFGIGVFDGIARIFRNNDSVEYKLPFDAFGRLSFFWNVTRLVILWEPEESDYIQVETQTEPFKMSMSYLYDIENKDIIRKSDITSERDIIRIVFESLDTIENRIRFFNCYNIFWNIDGKIKKPKIEIHIQPIILEMLERLLKLHGMSIKHENKVGNGSIDYLIEAAQINAPALRLVCELKLAHNMNVKRTVDQLNQYMTSMRIDHGILIIVWFKCEHFPYPSYDLCDFFTEVKDEIYGSGLKNVTLKTIDLSPGNAPSKSCDNLKKFST